MSADEDWMRPMDRRILEFMAESRRVKMAGLWFRPVTVAKNLDATRQYVSRRLGELVEHGFVEHSDDGFYRITDKGYYLLQ